MKADSKMTGNKMPIEGVLKSMATKRLNGTNRPSDEHILKLSKSNIGLKKQMSGRNLCLRK